MRRVGGFVRLPPFAAGQTIGLLGGSFNPPHRGHLLASEIALKRLGLDRVWWLATPGNPLKSAADLAALRVRIEAAQALVRDRRIAVTGFESEIGSRYTADTLRYLMHRAPGARFVWIMGADNLAQFHRWRDWRAISAQAPILIVDRPGSSLSALSSRAAQALSRRRLAERDAAHLAFAAPPAWVFLHGPRVNISSTVLRRRAP